MEEWLNYEVKFREIVSQNPDDFELTSVADTKRDYRGAITSWNIDVSGQSGDRLVVYECRDRKRKPTKPDLGELAFRLDDLNTKGFVVSPKGFTSGAGDSIREEHRAHPVHVRREHWRLHGSLQDKAQSRSQ